MPSLSTLAFAALSAFHLWKMRILPPLEDIPVGFTASVFEDQLLANGAPMKTRYTGIAPIDVELSMLVAAFVPGTAGWDPVYRQQQIYFLFQFFAVCCIMTIESHRSSNRDRIIRFVGPCALLYQTLGGAFILPLYYLLFVRKPANFAGADVQANLLLPLVLGYLVPTVLMFIPWDDLVLSQNFAAVWQCAPMYPNMLAYLFPSRKANPRRIYVLAGVVALASHAYLIYGSTDPTLSLPTVMLPNNTPWKADMASGLLYIFQWDFIGIFAASLLWCWLSVIEVWDISGAHSGAQAVKAGAVIGLLTLVGGPGTAMAVVWYWREGKIAESQKVKKP